MSGPLTTDRDLQDGSPTSGGNGGGDHQRATSGPPARPSWLPARGRRRAGDTASPIAGGPPAATAGDRRFDHQRAAGGSVRHDIAVPAPDGTGALVMTSRAGERAQQVAEGLRFVNLRNHTLAETLNYAWHAQSNLTHIPLFRAMNVAFFFLVTAPLLIVARYLEWVHLRLHRALAVWGLVLVVAHFLNRLVDGFVPDLLDAGTWSATTWTWVAAGGFMFAATTVGVLIWGRRRP